MNYYLIAGEASGDLHGSNLMQAMKQLDTNATFRVWGGDLMKNAGGQVVKHYRELAFMGFKEVVTNLPAILSNIKFCKNDLLAHRPDVLVLIDYPGFNLRIADFAHRKGMKVVYYISPQLWAWKAGRVKTVKRAVDKMLCILPFEPEFYQQHGYPATFVGHPLLDAVSRFVKDSDFYTRNHLPAKNIVALLPGSRRQELSKILPVMLAAARHFPEYTFVIAGAPGLREADYPATEQAKVIFGQTYQLLAHSAAAMVTSGTATLETALFGVPQVVCYRGSSISYAIGKRLVKVKYISLPNLILDRPALTELIQHELTEENLVKHLQHKLQHGQHELHTQLKQKLGGAGASMRAASEIVEMATSEAQ